MARKKTDKPMDEPAQDLSIEEPIEHPEQEEAATIDEVVEDSSEEAETLEGEKSVAELEKENKSCKDQLLRMAAEFENYKKRMTRERENAYKYAEESILKELLPFVDNLERAVGQAGSTEDVKTVVEGVQLTLKGLMTTLNKFGLTPIESVGKPFDPNLHEALVMEASCDVPAQSVLREFEKGYYYKDRLLRAAKVVVCKGEE